MRTLTEIRSSGRILQVAASAVVMLLALAALAPPAQVDGAWLDAASIAALLACAGGLMAVTIGAPGLASMLAIVAFSGGVAALDRYQALGLVDGAGAGDASGLLSQVIALATMLGGLAIGAAAWLRKPRRRVMTVVSLGAVIVALGIAGLLHDLFPGIDMSGPALWLTVWRALLLVVLGTAVILVGRPVRRRVRSRLTRWLFLPVALAVAAGAVLLAQLVRIQEVGQLEARVGTTMERIGDQLTARLAGSVLGVDRMARSWVWTGQPDRNDWKTDAWLFVDHFPEVRAVAWVDPETRVRWLAPLAGSHKLQNSRLKDNDVMDGALQRAREQGGPAMSGPVELAIGGLGFIVAAPVPRGNDFLGYIVGFYHFDPIMDDIRDNVAPGYAIMLANASDRLVPRSPRDGRSEGDWWRQGRFETYGTDWTIRIAPDRRTREQYLTSLPGLTLAIGLALALLVGVAVYQAEVSRLSARRLGYAVERRARVEAELRRYQRDLEARVEARTADLHEKQQELERSNAELERLATTDELTGVRNRRRFLEIAEHELRAARRYDRTMSLIMFDLDHFKRINDRYGHQCGDTVLASAAETAGAGLRETDCLARYGGEEFAVLLPESARAEAEAVAERMRAALARLTVEWCGQELTVTASFGATSLLASDRDVDQLLERADRALYEAKGAGRDRVVYLDE
jgi:diguanylate cyclase (GGDEF)-like protein